MTHNNLGYLLETSKQQHEEAEKCYRAAIEVEPDCAMALNNLGHLLKKKKDVGASAAHYTRV